MEQECLSVALMAAEAGVTLTLPHRAGASSGMLYLHNGGGVLEGGEPLTLEPGWAVVYPGCREWRFTAWEAGSLTICLFSQGGAPEEPVVRDCRDHPLELRRDLTEDAGAAARLFLRLTASPEPERTEAPAFLTAARRIIEEYYFEDLPLDALALRVGRSKFHLARAFREWYHVTPSAYLISVRLTRAEELLTHTRLPVREIGQQVGLTNPAYFTSLFKRRYGLPPGKYRQAKRFAALK